MPGVTYKIAGVLGGMGPLATVDFLSKVIALTPAECDQEHVPLLVHQVPQIPDRNRAILEGGDTRYAPMLLGLHRLAAAGAEFAVIPCNSAHHWYERLATSQSLKILHIADAVRPELQGRDMASRSRRMESSFASVR
jgi:aspartate racemase